MLTCVSVCAIAHCHRSKTCGTPPQRQSAPAAYKRLQDACEEFSSSAAVGRGNDDRQDRAGGRHLLAGVRGDAHHPQMRRPPLPVGARGLLRTRVPVSLSWTRGYVCTGRPPIRSERCFMTCTACARALLGPR